MYVLRILVGTCLSYARSLQRDSALPLLEHDGTSVRNGQNPGPTASRISLALKLYIVCQHNMGEHSFQFKASKEPAYGVSHEL